MDLNDELKNLIMREVFGRGKDKELKDFMKLSIRVVGEGAEIEMKVHGEIGELMTPKERHNISIAANPLMYALEDIFQENEKIKSWLKAEKPNNGHDCENCPEDIKKECQDMKKTVKEEVTKSVIETLTNTANRSKGVN